MLGAGPLAWTSIEGELLSGWTSVLGVVVFGGVVLFALAVLWATTATVGTTIHAGLLRRFTVRGGVLAVILALSLAHLAGEQLNGALQSMGLEASTEWTSTLMLLGPFALFVWLTRPRVGVRPANLATVFDAALLLAPTLTAGMAATIYGGVALSFGVVLLVNPLMEGRPPTADELGQTQQAIHLFTPGPLASLYPWLAWTCVPLLLFGLLRRRPL